MVIEAKALQHWIDHFYGYGSWRAKFWFVGHEESGGDMPEEVAEKLNYFYTAQTSNTPTLCDIRELYRQVTFRIEGPRAEKFATFHDHRFGKEATLHGAWKNLIAFVHGYQQKKLPDLLDYQKKWLALSSAPSEALIQLYPLPAHNHAWYYAWLDLPFSFLKSRALYQEHVYPGRIRCILQNIITYQPEVVVMYGMNNINLLKNSVHKFFPTAKFKMVKAVKLEIPQHHWAEVNGTRLIITTQIPSLRHNRAETGFDWYAFGKRVQSDRV